LETAIKVLICNKTPGLDEIPPELWRSGGVNLIELFFDN
jgi:hypothetical protein